jgi:hypothetical protein
MYRWSEDGEGMSGHALKLPRTMGMCREVAWMNTGADGCGVDNLRCFGGCGREVGEAHVRRNAQFVHIDLPCFMLGWIHSDTFNLSRCAMASSTSLLLRRLLAPLC